MNSAASARFFSRHGLWWPLSLFAAALLIYLPFLGNPFVFDDPDFSSADIARHYTQAIFHFGLRWLSHASLGGTYGMFGGVSSAPFHFVNTLLHGINVILLFYLLQQLLGAVIDEHRESTAINWSAWFAALIFACHPVAVYAVGYIVQRSILMATLFALVMQLAWLRGLLTGQKRWLLLAVTAYFLAVFSKEHSVLSPTILIAMTILLRAKCQISRSALWFTGCAFAAVGLLLVLSSKGVLGSQYEFFAYLRLEQYGLVASTPMLHLLSVLTQAGLFFKYLLLWALPNPAWMSVDMRGHFLTSLAEWQGWVGALGFILYGVVAYRLLLRPRWIGLAGLALLYPWLQFWVELSSIRVQEPFVLYRSYLWMPGLALLVPWLLSRLALITVTGLPGRKTLLILAGTVLLLVSLAWNRLWVFRDNYRLWNDAVMLMPNEQVAGADRIFFNRGQAADLARRWDDAIADYQRAVALSPQLAPMRYALGMAYAKSRQFQQALTQLDVAITLQPEVPMGYYGKGLVLMQLHQRELALQHLEKSCELGLPQACSMAAQMTLP